MTNPPIKRTILLSIISLFVVGCKQTIPAKEENQSLSVFPDNESITSSAQNENLENNDRYYCGNNSVLAKISIDYIYPETVHENNVLHRECIVVDGTIKHDFFNHIVADTKVTIPIFVEYYPSGNTDNSVILTDEVLHLISEMDDSYFYFWDIIPGNTYPYIFVCEDGSYFNAQYQLPNEIFNLFFYHNLIYMIDDTLNEKMVTNLLEKHSLKEIECTSWDLERFIDGKTREEIETQIFAEVEYSQNNYFGTNV